MEKVELTKDELEVLDLLGSAASKFANLEEIHPSDRVDFTYAIHLAQNLIFARVGMRQYQQSTGHSYLARVTSAPNRTYLVKGISITDWHSPQIDAVLDRCGLGRDYQIVTKDESYQVDVASNELSSAEMAARLKKHAPEYALLYQHGPKYWQGKTNFIGFCPVEDYGTLKRNG